MKLTNLVVYVFYFVFIAIAFVAMQNAAITYANQTTTVGKLIYHSPIVVLVAGVALPLAYMYMEEHN